MRYDRAPIHGINQQKHHFRRKKRGNAPMTLTNLFFRNRKTSSQGQVANRFDRQFTAFDCKEVINDEQT